MQIRTPGRFWLKVSIILGMLITCLALPFAFGFVEGWFGVDYWTALAAVAIISIGGLVTAALIPGIGEAEAATLVGLYDTYGWDGMILL